VDQAAHRGERVRVVAARRRDPPPQRLAAIVRNRDRFDLAVPPRSMPIRMPL
jgi:hypothetical protein